LLPADVPPLEPGLTLQGVQVELDADTRFTATLQIQHISSINPQAQGLRVGCEWRTLERESERSLQRYIDQTQKRRRCWRWTDSHAIRPRLPAATRLDAGRGLRRDGGDRHRHARWPGRRSWRSCSAPAGSTAWPH
jgi:hypothetical protein